MKSNFKIIDTEDSTTDFKKIAIKNFDEYLSLIKQLKSDNNNLWFRGQFDCSYRLTPGILRNNVFQITDPYGIEIEPTLGYRDSSYGGKITFVNHNNMINEFKTYAKEYLSIKPKNDFEWMFLAQHYGIPTMLLDWTTDPLVALFFAVNKNIDSKEIVSINRAIEDFEKNSFSNLGAAVFIMDPRKINELIAMYKYHTYEPLEISNHYDEFKGYIYPTTEDNFLTPICIKSNIVDKRICRQSGNFTIHGVNIWPLDYYQIVQKNMYKVFIPYKCFEEIKEWLNSLDINKKSIYGSSDLDKISKDIKNNETINFYTNIEKIKEKYKDKNNII